jgi:hypothetical protein
MSFSHHCLSMRITLRRSLALAAFIPSTALAQDGVIVYRLGRDTAAVEQFSRTPTKFTGEMVTRVGAAVGRVQYDITLANGRPTAAVIRRRQADGTPVRNAPTETRFTFRADSAIRENVFADSTQRQAFATPNAVPAWTVFAYAPVEVLYAMSRSGARVDSLPAIPLAGTNVGVAGLEKLGGDTMRIRGGFYPMLVRFDNQGRLQSVDGSFTTNKSLGTRAQGRADIGAIALALKPTGQLSPRQTAHATFAQSPIFINYSSPGARGRTIWGGTLIPFDSIWRTGANEATHLAATRTLQIGDMTLAPGLYTLWTQHTRNGTFLIVNRQVGQWGTQYNPAQDVGRVQLQMAAAPQFVEDFTITIRPLPQGRGAIDFAWGDQVGTANFTLRP